MEVTRTFDLLERLKDNFQKDDILAGKEDGEWVKYSTQEYYDYAHYFAFGLLALDLKKGDFVATISNNRPEWNIIDMGISLTGAVHVPIYPTISIEDYRYILHQVQPKILIVSDKYLYARLRPFMNEIPSIQEIYTFNFLEEAKHWTEIYKAGKQKESSFKEELNRIKSSITENDLVTLLYTSGTTGNPKGVMLSHKNLVSNFTVHAYIHPYGAEARGLSFLPLSHIFERCVNYHYQFKGISIYYADSFELVMIVNTSFKNMT